MGPVGPGLHGFLRGCDWCGLSRASFLVRRRASSSGRELFELGMCVDGLMRLAAAGNRTVVDEGRLILQGRPIHPRKEASRYLSQIFTFNDN